MVLDYILEHPSEYASFLASSVAVLLLVLVDLGRRALRAGSPSEIERVARWLTSLALIGSLLPALARALMALGLAAGMGGTLGLVALVLAIALGLLLATLALAWLLIVWSRNRLWAAVALVALGLLYYGLSLPLRTIWYCEPLAYADVTSAKWCSARLYAWGRGGVRANRLRALEWLRSAAEDGHVRASYRVAQWDKDSERQRAAVERGAEAGLADAYYQLYRMSQPPDQDFEALAKAAERLHEAALYELSRQTRSGGRMARDLDRSRRSLDQAAARGSVPAMRSLAIHYAIDDALHRRDDALSEEWEERAQAGEVRKVPVIDLDRWSEKEWRSAASFWRGQLDLARTNAAAADQGDVDVQLELGRSILVEGQGEPEIEALGLSWIERAAEGGSGRAMLELADAHLRDGKLSQPDIGRGLHWLTRAAENGDIGALRRIVRTHKDGLHGRPVDLQAARHYSEQLLARLEDASPKERRLSDAWVHEETLQGIEAERRAHLIDQSLLPNAQKGDVRSQFALYRELRSTERTRAREWLHVSADGGFAEAQYVAGKLILNRQRTDDEANRAARWLLAAVEQGHRGAMVKLGYMYRNRSWKRPSELIPHDPERARYWLERALDGLEGDEVYREELGGGRATFIKRSSVERQLAALNDTP
jgi:TPR repeat protein